jgi:hypothetical protein
MATLIVSRETVNEIKAHINAGKLLPMRATG